MPFSIGEEYLPAILTAHPMTDAEFAELCSEHPDLFFEMTAEGELIVMPPNYSFTGLVHAEILEQLKTWAKREGRGAVTDAAAGFVLPSGARRSPDAAWALRSRILELGPKAIEESYWRLCPDFVIEVRSKTDRLRTLREKMREWIDNGAQLGWMIDPDNRSVEIYRPNAEPELFNNPEILPGEGPVDGFVLEMARVWDPLKLN